MQQELTTLKDQITAVIRVSAHSAKHVADFEKLITTMPFNIVAAQLEIFKLSERIASIVPCNLLVDARTTLHTAQIQYNNNIVPRQSLTNVQNVLVAIGAYDIIHRELHHANCTYAQTYSKGVSGDAYDVKYWALRSQGENSCLLNSKGANAKNTLESAFIILSMHENTADYIINTAAITSLNAFGTIIHNKYNELTTLVKTIQAQIKQEETNLAVLTQAQVTLDLQIQLQNNRATLADTFNIRATTLIALVSGQISPQSLLQSPIRDRIMRSKTDTLRMIRRDRDYSSHREATLTLIETWWSVNTAPQREGDITFTSAHEETEHFLAMCTVFDAENDTSVFTDRADDFDTTSISRFSRLSFASHPAAQQFL